MYGTFYDPDYQGVKSSSYYTDQHIMDTFKALVDAVIPRTPGLAEEYGKIQFFGALNLHTDEYLAITLNHYSIPLAEPTAAMLDTAAEQLVFLGKNNRLLDYSRYPGGGTFAALAPVDRFRALSLLDELKVDLSDLQYPYKDNPDFVITFTGALIRYTMMGYYSEWAGYGSTRLESPNDRKLEFYPLSWEQINYPGPSLGYRAVRYPEPSQKDGS
jgi:hypothetical protein